MTHVITSKCIGTKDTSCVSACPVDCIHPRSDEPAYAAVKHLFINPDECIDCGACESACPVGAIYPESEAPAAEAAFIQINAAHFR